MGSRPPWTDYTKIGRVEGAHDVIILSNFGLNIFNGVRSTGGQNLHFPINFAGHNSAAAPRSLCCDMTTATILVYLASYADAV